MVRKIKLSHGITLAEAIRMIKKLQDENPDREVYFDGEKLEVVVLDA